MSDWARPVVHWQLDAVDPERQRAFYAELFNWNVEGGPIMTVDPGFGGPEPGPGGHIQAGEQPRVSLWVQVRDLRASLDRVAELGGSVLGEPFDVPDGPTIAPIADPEGNPVMLVQQ